MELQKCTIENLQGGAAIERINDAFAEVVKNILDPNTKAVLKREINFTLKVFPSQNRDAAQFEIHCSTKLAPPREISGTIFVGVDGDDFVAYESNPDQQKIPFESVVPE